MDAASAVQSPPVKSFSVEGLSVRIFSSQDDLAAHAAFEVNDYLQGVLKKQRTAAAILATGNSQIQFLERLIQLNGVDWSRMILFHMDEYLGIAAGHSASFRRYMRERVEQRLQPAAFHYIQGDAAEPINECERYAGLLRVQPIDLCCLGIGENGHLAFNDPPVANFEDPHPVKIVKLDDVCRQQQVKQGHFQRVEDMPQYALTLTIPTLCSARKLLCLAPEARKAEIVRSALKGPMTPACPASILRKQSHAVLLLDTDSASLL